MGFADRIAVAFAACVSAFAAGAATVAPKGAGVDVVESGGVARIRFDVVPDTPFMLGNYPRVGADIPLMFDRPVHGEGCCRFAYEAKGVLVDGKHATLGVELRVMLEDEEGEVFDYFPKTVPGLKRSDRRYVAGAWDRYVTGNWYGGEAGAVSHDLCVRVSGGGNGRPDGVMRVLGYRLHLSRPFKEGEASAPVRGEVVVAGGKAMPRYDAGHPFIFADSLLGRSGRYVFRAAVSTEFQAPPSFGVEETFDFAPGDRRKLEVPVPGDGMYWMRWALCDAATGEQVAADDTRREVMGAMPWAKVGPPPQMLGVSGGDRGAFGCGERFSLAVVPPAGVRADELRYVLTPYYFKDVLSRGAVPPDGRLEFPRDDRFGAFRLIVSHSVGGRTLASVEFLFGERVGAVAERPHAGVRMTRDEVKKMPYNRLSVVCDDLAHAQRTTFAGARELFRTAVMQNMDWIRHYTVCPAPNHMEVLPGVWDFSLTDIYMDVLADYGCAATVRPCHSDRHDGPYRWSHSPAQRSYDGEPAGQNNPYGSYCGNDPEMVGLWKRLYRALHDRYRGHCGFEGYYLMDPAGETVVLDEPWRGILAGYGPAEQEAFRRAMEAKYRTVERLNAAWKTDFASFSDVTPPQPTLDSGVAPDMRAAWIDFMAYKQSLPRFWAETLVKDIRSYDQDRIVIGYFPPTTEWLYGLLDFGHNGGNHSLDKRGAYLRGWKDGRIGWITEPINPHNWAAHNDPGRGGWTLDVSVWTMLAQAGAGGANLHVYTIPQRGAVANQGGMAAFDRMESYFPILKEAHDAELIVPEAQIAFNADRDTMWMKHRTVFVHRISDLIRWRQTIEDDGFLPAELKDFPDRKFKLVCPNVLDEVISRETFDRYVRCVRDEGAKMVMSVRTGRFVTGMPDEEFPLLKAFGITPPRDEWTMTGEFEAVAAEGNPVMTAGRRFAFQTLARLERERADKEILSSFWRYPYRWLPETDYFGCYPNEKPNGEVVAVFEKTGCAAMTLHRVGKGEVAVFWGLPSMSGGGMKGVMAAAVAWAGVVADPAPVPDFFEMTNRAAKRHYGFFYRECAYGEKKVKFPNCPDGLYFADEMLTQRKLGRFNGRQLREDGLSLVWEKGLSPLKCVRLVGDPKWSWCRDYDKEGE